MRRQEMISTLFRKILRANHATGFQAYLNGIQSSGHGTGPTVAEARRDYHEMSHRSPYLHS
jgi:hypothetical protein